MKKLFMVTLKTIMLLLVSSFATAGMGTTNGRWCNEINGDFAGDCDSPTVHCSPGWGLKAGTCEYRVKGIFVGGVIKNKGRRVLKEVTTKFKVTDKKKKLKSKSVTPAKK